jgi:hypothetical protein
MFKAQRQIKIEDLATPETRLQLLGLTIEKLIDAGYIYIGMDHFALPDDELVLAQQAGTMYRNFQGYSTRGYLDLVGLGVSSIGKVGDNYIQNQKTLPEYYGALDRGELPVHRGYTMTRDDVIRRDVIQQIMCYGVLDFDATAARHGIDFRQYFANELVALADSRPRVRNVSVAVREHKSEIVFLRRVVPGGANKSYGIDVARLAGLPKQVIGRSREIMSRLEGGNQLGSTPQLSLLPQAAPSPALARIAAIDLDRTTPLEALQLLADLKKLL